MLYEALNGKLLLDKKDTTAVRNVRIIRGALNQKHAPLILTEAVAQNSAMYTGYYPLDENTYCEVLPRCGVLQFNQENMFNSQMENRMKRIFTGGLDLRDGVCCMYASLALPAPSAEPKEDISRLFYFMDVFASCLGVRPRTVSLEWYRLGQPPKGMKTNEK